MLLASIPTEPWDILFTPSFWWFLAVVVVLIVVERIVSWTARRTVTRLNLSKSAANNNYCCQIDTYGYGCYRSFAFVWSVYSLRVAGRSNRFTGNSFCPVPVAFAPECRCRNLYSGHSTLFCRRLCANRDNEGIVEEVTINYIDCMDLTELL